MFTIYIKIYIWLSNFCLIFFIKWQINYFLCHNFDFLLLLFLQADVEITFEIPKLDKVEEMDPKWANPQELCSQNGPSIINGLGPFGLLVLASKDLEEYTAVYFRIFKSQTKFMVLMCSDQSRFFPALYFSIVIA